MCCRKNQSAKALNILAAEEKNVYDTKENANDNRNVNIGKYATNKLLYINNLRK